MFLTRARPWDPVQLLSSGSDGVVYVWDLRTQRCLNRAVDEGCLHASSLAASADGRFVATGSFLLPPPSFCGFGP
jgi:WD40 repeat protein